VLTLSSRRKSDPSHLIKDGRVRDIQAIEGHTLASIVHRHSVHPYITLRSYILRDWCA
jgi:hypothetical protein